MRNTAEIEDQTKGSDELSIRRVIFGIGEGNTTGEFDNTHCTLMGIDKFLFVWLASPRGATLKIIIRNDTGSDVACAFEHV